MNKTLTLLATLSTLGAASLTAHAQEMGRVLSATPIMQQVAIPQQVCNNETIYQGGRESSGAGAVLGAIAGGAAGNAIGGGSGRAAATAIGLIGGAIIGNNLETRRPGYENVQRCSTETFYDNRIVGYDVVYEYAGRQYTTRTQADPGQWIALNVQPAAQNAPAQYYGPNYSNTAPNIPYGSTTYGPTYGNGSYSGSYTTPGVVVTTRPGPPAYLTPPVTVIQYPDYTPYRPHRDDRRWR